MSAAMRDVVLRIMEVHGLKQVFLDVAHVGEVHLKLVHPPYFDLVIERLIGPDHGCMVVSVAHYLAQNGDLMRDPEMVFDASDWLELYLRNDMIGSEEYVFTDPNRKHYYPWLAREFRSFSATWARNLIAQGWTGPQPIGTSLSHPLLLPARDKDRNAGLS